MSDLENPFDPSQPSLDGGTTKPLSEIILDAIDGQILKAHTQFPCQVVKVLSNNKVNIQPAIKRTFQDGSIVSLPVIQNVPVWMPRGDDYWVKLPIAEGDSGIALVSERSLDEWLVSGGIVDPQDTRHHDLSDAVFFPGLYPFSNEIEGEPEDMVLHNGTAEIFLKKSGKFKITNGSNELLSLMDDLLDTLQNNTFTLTLLGPEPFIASTVLALQQIRTKLGTLKE